jgi:hypothetical protein
MIAACPCGELGYFARELISRMEIADVESLSTALSRERFLTFRIPERVPVVIYIGIPLTGTLLRGHAQALGIKNDGPNDRLCFVRPDLP